jgi:hypothetical protein
MGTGNALKMDNSFLRIFEFNLSLGQTEEENVSYAETSH